MRPSQKCLNDVIDGAVAEFLGRGRGQAVSFGLGATVRFAPTLVLVALRMESRYDEQSLKLKPVLPIDSVGRCASRYSIALCNQPFGVGFLISSIACKRAYLNHRNRILVGQKLVDPILSLMTTSLWAMS